MSRDKSGSTRLGWILLAGLLYLGLLFNRGVGVVDEGWVSHVAHQMINGEVPYRDFFIHFMPGSPYIQALLYTIFGEKLIVLRAYGLVQGLGFILLAYGITKYYLPRRAAALAALLMLPWNIFVFHRMAHYNVDSIFYAMLSVYFLIVHTNSGRLIWLILASLAAGGVFFCKQNMGAASVFILVLAVMTYSRSNVHTGSTNRRIARTALALAFFFLPLLLLVLYYAWIGILPEFYHHTVKRALISKEGWVVGHLLVFVIPGFILTLLYLAFMAWMTHRVLLLGRLKKYEHIGLLSLVLVILHAAWMWLVARYNLGLVIFLVFLSVISLLVMLSALALSEFDRKRQFLEPKPRRSLRLTLLFCITFWAAGLSSGVDFAHVITGACLGLLIVPYLSYYLDQRYRGPNQQALRKVRTAAIVFLMIIGFAIPLTREGVLISQEPWWKSWYPVEPELLSGIRVSRGMQQEINGIHRVIQQELEDDQTYLVFPLGGLYYSISSKPCPLFNEFLFYEIFYPDEQAGAIEFIERHNVKLVFMASGDHTLGRISDGGCVVEIVRYIYDNYEPGEQLGRYRVFRRI